MADVPTLPPPDDRALDHDARVRECCECNAPGPWCDDAAAAPPFDTALPPPPAIPVGRTAVKSGIRHSMHLSRRLAHTLHTYV